MHFYSHVQIRLDFRTSRILHHTICTCNVFICCIWIEFDKNSIFKYLILIAIGFEGFVNQKHDFRIKEPFGNLIFLEKDLDQFSIRTDLIMINSGLFPTPMYFAHRKGWVESNDKIINKDYMDAAINLGLKYVVILKRALGTEIKLDYPCIFNTQDYAIYKVSDQNSPNSK